MNVLAKNNAGFKRFGALYTLWLILLVSFFAIYETSAITTQTTYTCEDVVLVGQVMSLWPPRIDANNTFVWKLNHATKIDASETLPANVMQAEEQFRKSYENPPPATITTATSPNLYNITVSMPAMYWTSGFCYNISLYYVQKLPNGNKETLYGNNKEVCAYFMKGIHIDAFPEAPVHVGNPILLPGVVEGRTCSGNPYDSSRALTFQWSISPSPALAVDLNAPSLYIPPKALQTGRTYTVSVQMNVSQTESYTASMVKLAVPFQSLRALISGGARRQVPINQPLQLDGSQSYDPDNYNFTGDFTWDCTRKEGKIGCNGLALVNGSSYFINSNMLNAGEYEFSMTYSKDNRSAEAFVGIVYAAGDFPIVTISPRSWRFSSHEQIILTAQVSGVGANKPNTFLWELVSPTGVSLESLKTNGLASPVLIVSEKQLTAGTTYTFRCTVKTYGYETAGWAEFDVIVAEPPAGSCSVSPSSGTVFETQFTINCNDFSTKHKQGYNSSAFEMYTDDENEYVVSWLTYEYGLVLDGAFVAFNNGQTLYDTFTTTLPLLDDNVTVTIRVTDPETGAVAVTTANTKTVLEVDAMTLLQMINATSARLDAAIQSGSQSEILDYATKLAVFFNSNVASSSIEQIIAERESLARKIYEYVSGQSSAKRIINTRAARQASQITDPSSFIRVLELLAKEDQINSNTQKYITLAVDKLMVLHATNTQLAFSVLSTVVSALQSDLNNNKTTAMFQKELMGYLFSALQSVSRVQISLQEVSPTPVEFNSSLIYAKFMKVYMEYSNSLEVTQGSNNPAFVLPTKDILAANLWTSSGKAFAGDTIGIVFLDFGFDPYGYITQVDLAMTGFARYIEFLDPVTQELLTFNYTAATDDTNRAELLTVVIPVSIETYNNVSGVAACYYFDEKTQLWFDEGCKAVELSSTSLMCQCSHATVFSVGSYKQDKQETVKEIVSVVLFTLLGVVVGLVICAFLFILFKTIQNYTNSRSRAHANSLPLLTGTDTSNVEMVHVNEAPKEENQSAGKSLFDVMREYEEQEAREREERMKLVSNHLVLKDMVNASPYINIPEHRPFTSVKDIGFREEANPRHRSQMEDGHCMIDGFNNDPTTGYFAVYDGHGGTDAVEYVQNFMHRVIADEWAKEEELVNAGRAAAAAAASNGDATVEAGVAATESWSSANAQASTVGEAASSSSQQELTADQKARGFVTEDGLFTCDTYVTNTLPAAAAAAAAASNENEQQQTPQPPKTKFSFRDVFYRAYHRLDKEMAEKEIGLGSGSTSITCIVREEVNEKGEKIKKWYSANCGDARVVLCRDGKAVRLTKDHKAAEKEVPPEEVARIKDLKGFVARGRVNGVLAITRSLGDGGMKTWVIPDPFYSELELNEKDSFVILACDGLWDVLSDQEAVDLVKDMTDAQQMACALIDKALPLTKDNVTIMVVRLQ